VPDQEQPEVVLADPQRLQALRRALEERAVLTYCTDGATFLPATPLGQVITQQVVMGEGPLIGVSWTWTSPTKPGPARFPSSRRRCGCGCWTHRDIRRRARQARAVATELRWEALRCED
jgi:hypothetical protein